MTVLALLGLGPRRYNGVGRGRVRVRVYQPKPEVPHVSPAKCPRCPTWHWWRPSFLVRCRWCADTGVWTEWRTELPGQAVQRAVR